MNSIPYGYCQCGCGRKTTIALRTRGDRIAGEPAAWIVGHNAWNRSPSFMIDPTTGCWVWLGSTNAAGYGVLTRRGTDGSRLWHRNAYQALRGPISRELLLHHTCHNPPCGNPDHLQVVTQQEDRHIHGPTNMKPFCKRGHAMEGDNVVFSKSGHRYCHACDRIRGRETRRRLRHARR